MDKNILWYRDRQIEKTIESLEKRNMKGIRARDIEEAKKIVLNLIEEDSIVGVGDSISLEEAGILDLLRSGSYNFLDKYRCDISSEEKRQIYLSNFSADSFLSSTNALTEDGELFNIDGNGSRIAPILYGPNQVIILVGINKIVRNIEEAENRVRNYSAPLDAKRLDKNTPCTRLGHCIDCQSPDRICNDFVVIRGQFVKDRIKVIIIEEELGY